MKKLEKEDKEIDYFEVVIRYVLDVKEDMNVVDIIDIVSQISSEKGGEVMTIADKLKQEGIEKGRKEGREEGLEEGLQRPALKLLIKKFGSLPAEYKEEIKKKDAVELDVILDNIIDMESISDLEKYIK